MRTTEFGLIKNMVSPFKRNFAAHLSLPHVTTYSCMTQERAEAEQCQQAKVDDSTSIASPLEWGHLRSHSIQWNLNLEQNIWYYIAWIMGIFERKKVLFPFEGGKKNPSNSPWATQTTSSSPSAGKPDCSSSNGALRDPQFAHPHKKVSERPLRGLAFGALSSRILESIFGKAIREVKTSSNHHPLTLLHVTAI